jgi:regulator of protease activity HflC (stomatin/prohibitin superfamily)
MELVVICILLIVFLAAAIKVVKEFERIAVFRLGRFFKIAGPGLVLLLPFVDKGVKVNMKEKIPEWQTMSSEELENRLKRYVLYESRANPSFSQ